MYLIYFKYILKNVFVFFYNDVGGIRKWLNDRRSDIYRTLSLEKWRKGEFDVNWNEVNWFLWIC